MKNFIFKSLFSLVLLLGLALVFNASFSKAETFEEPVEEQAYSNEELLQMSSQKLDELGLKGIVREGLIQESNNGSLIEVNSTFTHRAGDILVTKNSQCKDSVKCSGITGHTGIVLNNGNVLHIRGPGYFPTQISINTWYSNYSATKVVRPNNATEGKNAATWAYNFYVIGSGKRYEYDVRTTLNGSGKTYCSKLACMASI